jgi:hypothetical protein
VLRTAVRRFLARGRLARLAACLAIAFAAVIWIELASVVLRVLFVAVLVAIVLSCVWLMIGIWVERPADREELGRSAWRAVRQLVRRAGTRSRVEPEYEYEYGYEPYEPEPTPVVSHELARDDEELERRDRERAEREAALVDVRSSVDAAIAELVRREERLHSDAEQLQQKLAEQIEAMRAVVSRMAEREREVAFSPPAAKQPVRERAVDPETHTASPRLKVVEPEPAPAPGQHSEFDLQAARLEVEVDLRLEKIEEQEEMLRELEEQLRRREHQLADFVAQTQSQLSPAL